MTTLSSSWIHSPLAASVLTLIWFIAAPQANAQEPDPLVEEIRGAEANRDAAYRELEARRAEYLEALRRTEELERRETMRPSFVAPYSPYRGFDPIAEAEAYRAQSYLAGPRPYVLRPTPAFAAPIGPGAYRYGPGPVGAVAPYAPYGYGYPPLGGIDIPFGFGLGGLSIRW